tara:strand:+ start:72 stop:1343 length:1272 start_codon:yes stop_codon:yes gene_type:complete
MASSFSTDLKLELMATGENAGTWGDKTNTNLNLIQQAIAGFEQVTLSSGGTLALAMTNQALSNARNMVIKFATASIASSTICTVPDGIEKFYIFDATGLTNPENLQIKTASGTGFTLDAAKIYAAYADGTNLKEISLDTLGGTIGTAQIADDAVNNDKIADGAIDTTAKLADDVVTFAKMQDTTTANRVLGAVTAGTIGEVQVQQAMIADDAVGADQLANTTVTAGTFTSATITVDAQGRLTAASSGSAGVAGTYALTFAHSGGETGTFTANASTTRLHVFGSGGGGGSGSHAPRGNVSPGGKGAYGMAQITVSNPFSVPFRIGQTGTSNSQVNGNAGQSTFIGSPAEFEAGAGNGGMYPGTGNDGSCTVGPAGTLFANSNPGTGIDTQREYMTGVSNADAGTKNNGGSGDSGFLMIFENIGS